MLDGSTIARAILVLVAAAATVGSFRIFAGQEVQQETGQQSAQRAGQSVVERGGPPNPPAVVRSAGRAPEPVSEPAPEPTPGGPSDPSPATPGHARAVAATAAAPVPDVPAPAAAAPPVPADAAAAGASGGLDLNEASVAALNRLAGGGSIGRAIVRRRPYRSVEDLLRKRVVSRGTFERIKDQVSVR